MTNRRALGAVCAAALALLAPMVALASAVSVRQLAAFPLWPNGVSAGENWPGKATQPALEELRDSGTMLWNVTVPTLQPYLPSRAKANGVGIIVAPGGGFRLLAIQHEGEMVARWLAARGYAAFVLKYRVVAQMPGENVEDLRKRIGAMGFERAGEAGVADGRQALRLLRAQAGSYGVDPHRIGVVGFSAGGHIAGMLAHEPKRADRPDFAGLIYGLPFASLTPLIPAAHLPYPPGTPNEPWLQPTPTPAPDALPPLFIAMAQDDKAVGTGVRDYYARLFAAGYRPELHLYAHGEHGFGLRGVGTTVDHWIEEFDWWMQDTLRLQNKRMKP